MYEDPDFVIDKKSEAYNAIKTTRANESDEEDAEPKRKTLNKVFSGTTEDVNAEPVSFEDKKKNKKGNDKIIKNYSEINKRMREKGN